MGMTIDERVKRWVDDGCANFVLVVVARANARNSLDRSATERFRRNPKMRASGSSIETLVNLLASSASKSRVLLGRTKASPSSNRTRNVNVIAGRGYRDPMSSIDIARFNDPLIRGIAVFAASSRCRIVNSAPQKEEKERRVGETAGGRYGGSER